MSHPLLYTGRAMRIINNMCEDGTTVMEYVAENDADRELLSQMQLDGRIPNAPSQRDQARKPNTGNHPANNPHENE